MPSNRMPGFTAEAAVYASETSYRTAGPPADRSSGVFPSLVAPTGTGGRGCIPGCICITQKGCPCCSSIYKGGGRVMKVAMRDAGAPPQDFVNLLDAWCTAQGGGMQSMADGTVQCNL
jgi:hypothetical protein